MSKAAWALLGAVLAACSNGSPRERTRQAPADWRTVTAARELQGEKTLSAQVQFGAGTLDVRPGDPGILYRAMLRYDQRQMQPTVQYADGQLRVAIDAGQGHHVNMDRGHANRLELRLGPAVPLDLNVEYGAGEGTLDLGGLAVQQVHIKTGASKTTLAFSKPTTGTAEILDLQAGAAAMRVTGIGNLSPRELRVQGGVGDLNLDFSGAWRGDLDAHMNMGVGSLHLAVPRGVGLRVRKNSVLTHFEAADMNRQGDVYESTGYQTAPRHLNVDIEAAFGSIQVSWVAGGSSF